MITVYALASTTKNYIYVGMTNNLERRLHEHDSNQNKSTKGRGPYRLLYKEELETREKARAREKHLKSGAGKEYLCTLI